MSTLYIRLPSRSAADSTARWLELVCPFALASGKGSIEREGMASLAELSGAIANVRRVVLLLAASDVTLLCAQIPPLSAARLKAALPNLVEERLIADPSACTVVAGGLSGGLRTVAVMQRDWLDFLVSTLIASGARRIVALPAQLCLPGQPAHQGHPGGVTAAVSERGNGIDMTLRFSEQEGIGLAIAPAPSAVEGDGTRKQHEVTVREVIRTLCALVPDAPITLYVPQPAVRDYREAIKHADTPNKHINILADNWPSWIAGAHGAALDLMAGSGMVVGSVPDWRAWRWPIGLAAAVLLINAVALNAGWWRLKSEASSLRANMIQIYKSVYPKETVILDPVAQMRQKLDAAKRNAGLPAPDDFTAILATFGDAWSRTMAGTPVIEGLEYRGRSLFVRLRPNIEVPLQQVKTLLAERGLSLDVASAQPAVWEIRSAK